VLLNFIFRLSNESTYQCFISCRVEGRGAATIHDVTISTIAPPPIPTSSPLLVELLSKQKRVEKSLARTLKSLSSLETYLSSLKAEHLQVTKLQEVVEQYDSTAGDLDEKVTELEKELKETEEAIKEERKRLAGPTGNEKLNLKATIGVFADSEGEIKIALIYGTWYEPCQNSQNIYPHRQPSMLRHGALAMTSALTCSPKRSP